MDKVWQQFLIRLALSPRMRERIQTQPTFASIARRFVGGSSVDEILQTVKDLRLRGFKTSLYYLGEYVTDPDQIARNVASLVEVAQHLASQTIEIHLSVDPTQIGYQVSPNVGWANAQRLGAFLAQTDSGEPRTLLLDMEDTTWVDPTIALHTQMSQLGGSTGLTIQAYLYRSEADIKDLMARGNTTVRLVKGAFAPPRSLAWQSRADIRRNYMHLARLLLSPEAKSENLRPVFATHDALLTDAISAIAAENRWPKEAWEFEMLYGVRESLQQAMLNSEHAVRIYLPFGTQWWPYVARRIGENPRNMRLIWSAIRDAR